MVEKNKKKNVAKTIVKFRARGSSFMTEPSPLRDPLYSLTIRTDSSNRYLEEPRIRIANADTSFAPSGSVLAPLRRKLAGSLDAPAD